MKYIAAVLNLLVPGWGYLVLNRAKLAFLIQFILIGAVLATCWSRVILNPFVFFLLFISIICIHLSTFVFSLKIQTIKSINMPLIRLINTIGFPAVFLTIAAAIYFFRATVLGFGLYHIPTRSMAPALLPGDIILVDTWAYQDQQAHIGDIVLFFRSTLDQRTLIKRITRLKHDSVKHTTRYFVEGDNRDFSNDSRHFGWIDQNQLKGQAKEILLTYTNGQISFERTGKILVAKD